MVTEYEKKQEYAKRNISLHEYPNMKRVQEFVMEVNRKVVA